MLQTVIGQLVRDSIHGGILKSLALLARALFFVFVVPLLAIGELSIYMYINSTALVIATVAIVGLNEELPRVIGGDIEQSRGYFRWFVLLNLLAMLALFAMYIQPSIALGIVLFAVTLMAGRFLAGIIRSIDPAAFEQVQNVPWILFIVCVVALRMDNAFDLLITRAATMCIVQWYGLFVIARRADKSRSVAHIPLLAVVKRGISRGISKLSSNLFLIGVLRGPIILPVWLGIDGNLDSVAFAVAVGEMVVQFGLIPANRVYAKWCNVVPRWKTDWQSAIITSLVLAAGLSGVSLLVFSIVDILQLLPAQASSLEVLAQALVFYSLVSAFYLIRYLVWSRGILEYWVVIICASMFVLSAAAIIVVNTQYWFALLAAIIALGGVSIAIMTRRYFTESA